MREQEVAATLARLEAHVIDLREKSFPELKEMQMQHAKEDDRRFEAQDRMITKLQLSNARHLGIAVGVLGLLSAVSAIASVWALLKS